MQVKVRTASWLGHSLPRTTRCLCFASHSKHSTATLNFKKERSKKPVLGCLVKNLWREATEQAKQVGCFRREIAAGFQSTIAACFAAAILFLQISVAHAAEDSLTVRFKASKDPEIRRVQEALVEAWGYVGTQYLDPKINGVDWPKELQVEPLKQYGVLPNSKIRLRALLHSKVCRRVWTKALRPKNQGMFTRSSTLCWANSVSRSISQKFLIRTLTWVLSSTPCHSEFCRRSVYKGDPSKCCWGF